MIFESILILGLIVLAIISFKRIDFGLAAIILSLPLYFIRLEILFIPTTVLELMIYVVFGIWIIKKIKELCRRQKRTKDKIFVILNLPVCSVGRFQNLFISSFVKKVRKTFSIRSRNKFGMTISIFLILLGCIISIIVSPNKQIGLGILKGWFIDPLLLFLIIVDVVKLPPLTPPSQGEKIPPLAPPKIGGELEGVIKILSFLAVSGIIVAVIGLFYSFFNELTYDGRLKAFFLSPNHLAMYLAPAGIICFGLFLYHFYKDRNLLEKRQFTADLSKAEIPAFAGMTGRYLWLFGFIICSITIFLTYSYGAWLGFSVALLFLFSFSFIRNNGRKKILLLIIISLFLSTIFFSQYKAEKFQNLTNFSRSSFESRIMIWKASLAILKDHSILGIGPGNFQNFYLDYQKKFPPYLEWAVPQPHNLFLAFYLQCGLFGLIGFLWLIFLFFKKGFHQLSISNFQFSAILLAAMLYILIHGLIDTPYWKNDLSIVFWIIIGLMFKFKNEN